jgi:hypothetical protein
MFDEMKSFIAPYSDLVFGNPNPFHPFTHMECSLVVLLSPLLAHIYNLVSQNMPFKINLLKAQEGGMGDFSRKERKQLAKL